MSTGKGLRHQIITLWPARHRNGNRHRAAEALSKLSPLVLEIVAICGIACISRRLVLADGRAAFTIAWAASTRREAVLMASTPLASTSPTLEAVRSLNGRCREYRALSRRQRHPMAKFCFSASINCITYFGRSLYAYVFH